MTAPGSRLCECGCGTSLEGRRRNVRYATDPCRARAWKTRTGYSLQATRKACQTRQGASSRSGLQLSYRKAVTVVAALLADVTGQPDGWSTCERVAAETLAQALPEAQRARLQQREPAHTRIS